METKQDKYDPKICKPLFGPALGDTKPVYELRHVTINCMDCKNYVILGNREFCHKAGELEKKIAKAEPKQAKPELGWNADEAYKTDPYDSNAGWKNPLYGKKG